MKSSSRGLYCPIHRRLQIHEHGNIGHLSGKQAASFRLAVADQPNDQRRPEIGNPMQGLDEKACELGQIGDSGKDVYEDDPEMRLGRKPFKNQISRAGSPRN